MSATPTPDALLAGPRGRRLCFELLRAPADGDVWRLAFHATVMPAAEHTAALIAAIEEAEPVPVDEWSLLIAFGQSVDAARYWQGPDDEDQLLATLMPTARRVAASTASAWWTSSVALDDQHFAKWSTEIPDPSLIGAVEKLDRWRSAAETEEQTFAEYAVTSPRPVSGSWWSTPALAGLPTTTRSRPGLGALSLQLVEDNLGWDEPELWPLRPTAPPRVFEISGPEAWLDLVTRYPTIVTESRQHVWGLATGVDGAWAIPDWAGVASAYDAVHLTVAGYLATAGRALPVAEGVRTVLAGWDPDQTYWLADVLEHAGEPVRWHRDDEGGWST